MSRKYSHVIVIGVDGAGSWFKDTDSDYLQLHKQKEA